MTALEEGRQSYEDHYSDIATYTYPRAYRWLCDDWNKKGNKSNQKIVDPTATLAARAFVSAFSSSVTPRSRPWMDFESTDPDFKDNYNVSTYLAACKEETEAILLRSNFYQEMDKLYEQYCLFSTGCMLIEEDFENVIRCETMPAGKYYIGIDARREVTQFGRKFQMTAVQMAQKFGEKNLPQKVKDALENKDRRRSQRFDIVHYIGPNDSYTPLSLEPDQKAFYSCYYECGKSRVDGDSDFLRESGYDEFPLICPRWKSYDDDAYGQDGPGMIALGHTKELQHARKQMAKAIEKQVNPPLQAPESARRQSIESIPGSVNNVDDRGAGNGIRPLYQVQFDVNGVLMMIQDLRSQIKEAYFYNLFLMVANERRSGTKAREIDELAEEKMMMLVSAFEQITQEGLEPALDRIFSIGNRLGRFPEPPPEFVGHEFSVKFTSAMAHAMQLVGIGNIDRAIAVLGQVGSTRPEVLDLINFDRTMEDYLDRLGIDPRNLNSPEEVAQIRDARARQVAAQQQQQQAALSADTAKVLSDTKIDTDNALGALVDQARGL